MSAFSTDKQRRRWALKLPGFSILFLLLCTQATAQVSVPVFGKQALLSGYASALQGETLPYFSVYPDYAREALLTRCTDGKKIIEWETAPVPAEIKGPYVYFSWIAAHSTGTSKGVRHFDLYINNELALTFSTQPKSYPPYWTFSGKDSTQLVFELKKQDGADDAHGIAYLRVPAARCEKGKPLTLKVVGQNQNSSDWYMTFKYTFEEKIDVEPLPFLLKGKPARQALLLTVLHFGKPATLHVQINAKQEKTFAVSNGIHSFEIPVPAVAKAARLSIHASIGKLLSVDKTIALRPVTQRDIYLIHHSHNDIGYSHIQEEVEAIQNNNIRRALELIEKTKNYPAGSRFVWNVECLWAVENFLNQANPKEKSAFIKAVQNRQIGLSAFYANVLTGLCTPEELKWTTDYATLLREQYKLPIQAVMMSDIPGISWSTVHALASNGVRYFSNGPNYVEAMPDQGDRIGATLRELGDKPFWWKSPSGKDSILLWTGARGYSSWHGFAQGAVHDRGKKKIAAYLNQLDATGYPYSMVQWRYNIVADNGPVDSTISDFVKKWNERYESPRLILANVTDMFEAFEKKYGATIPTLSGDLTPYWEDGAYSSAREESQNRLLSQKILQLEDIAAQKGQHIDSLSLYRAKRNVVMFHEHTWGSWNCVSDPDNPFAIHQWEYKKRFLDSAQYYVDRIKSTLFPPNIPVASIEVINTLPWTRSGYVESGWPEGFRGTILLDERGNKIPVQKLANGRLAFIAKDIPAQGIMKYQFTTETSSPATAFESPFTYAIDSLSGAIRQLSAQGREWVDPAKWRGLLQTIYVKGLNPDSFFLTKVKNIAWVENGPLVRTQRIACSLEGARDVQYEITQYKGLDYIKLSVIIDKKAIRDKESVHIAFPFAIQNPTVRVGIDDSLITPEKGQLPGSNKDFFSVERWIDVSGPDGGVTISSPQGALFEVGNMTDEHLLQHGAKIWRGETHSAPTIFLYALNNYWYTNYKADQSGVVQFDFILRFHSSFDLQSAHRFGIENGKQWIMDNG